MYNHARRRASYFLDEGDGHREIIKTSQGRFYSGLSSVWKLVKSLKRFRYYFILLMVYVLYDMARGEKGGHQRMEVGGSSDPNVSTPSTGSDDVVGNLKEERKWKKLMSEEERNEFQRVLIESNRDRFLQRKKSQGNEKGFRSGFECLGKQNEMEALSRRPCRFHRVCISKGSDVVEYYLPSKEPVFYDAFKGPLYSFDQPGVEGFIQVNSLWYGYVSRITPIVKYGKPKMPVWVNDTTVIWASWSYEYNLGHFLYEELASAYFALVRFGILDMENLLPLSKRSFNLLDMRYSKDNQRYQHYLKFFSGAVSSRPVQGIREYIDSVLENGSSNQVCFQDLVVASATRAFLSPRDEYQFGTEPIWYRYRRDLLEYNQVNSSFIPNNHLIVFIQKEGSMYKNGENRKHFRDLVNFHEMVNHVKMRFPDMAVKVINPANLEIKKQMELMVQTTILITPPGGVSMVLPFLPKHSHAIIFDYYGQDNNLVMTREGESVSMEASLWNAFPHFHKHYYQILDPEHDIVPDFEHATDTREDYSVNVDLDRIEFMINSILDQSIL